VVQTYQNGKNIPDDQKIDQMTKNRQNGQKIDQMAKNIPIGRTIDQMAIKYSNIFYGKTLQN
jgi:hypothetical protein